MPNNETAKTKSEPKKRSLWKYAAVSLAVLALLIGVFWPYGLPTTTLNVNGHKVTLWIASTSTEQAKGLGDRKSMADDQGMLFSYTSPTRLCFWMKDMEYPLDMVWLNHSKQIVYIRSDVTPSTYPETFCAPGSTQYVIELNAGEVSKLGLHNQMYLHF